MIGHVGIPGSQHFAWRRFAGPGAKRRAQQWAEIRRKHIAEVWPAVGLALPARTLSERDAAKVRWRDGSKVFPVGDLFTGGQDV